MKVFSEATSQEIRKTTLETSWLELCICCIEVKCSHLFYTSLKEGGAYLKNKWKNLNIE